MLNLLRSAGFIGFMGTLFLCGCTHQNPQEYQETRAYLGANVTIRCFFDPQKDAASTIKKCWDKMDFIQQEMNAYSKTGDLARINKSSPRGVVVHQETYRLLKDCLEFSRLSKGAFDITVFPLVKLWKDAEVKGQLPDKEALEAAKSKVGYQKINLQGPSRIVLAQEGMRLDFGAVVSGYACDELAAILDAGGIKDYMIDTGGEIFCRGKEAGKIPWKIGIQDPADKNIVLMSFDLRDECASTSGNYEKFYTIEGARFSHIIDPRSGYPQEDVISATVIAPTGKQADALSTALCVLGGKKGIALANSLQGVRAIILEHKDGKTATYKTGGFR
jgi:thiamine biosynthesis lipoprotein